MDTKIINFIDGLAQASQLIKQGEVVAFPTETVYGLGANAFDENAVKKIFIAKGRPQDNPLIVHVCNKSMIEDICLDISDDAYKIIDTFMPNSITLVLKKRPCISDTVTAGLNNVGVRMPKSTEALTFIKNCGVPIAAPSANTSSRPSPTKAIHVYEDLNGKIPLILNGEDCDVGIESTVLDLSGDEPVLLRPGIITAIEIENLLGKKVIVPSKFNDKMNSPGIRYKHYSPKIPLYLNLDGDIIKTIAKADELMQNGQKSVIMCRNSLLNAFSKYETFSLGENAKDTAKILFDALRVCEKKFDVIIAVWDDKTSLGNSVLNRIQKSAGGNIF